MNDRVTTPVCYRHPDRPTRVSCSECERPICVECTHDAAVGQKCPEHAKSPGRHRIIDARRTTGSGSAFYGAPFVKWTIIVTAAIHLIGFGSVEARDWLYQNFQHDNIELASGEIWRMVTHALLHSQGSLFHVLFNMYALYLFGPTLERRVGSVAFGGLYVASAATGSAAAFFIGPISMRAVGASGAVFGLFGAWLYVSWRQRQTFQGRARFNQLAVLIGINLALPLFISNIAWQAHIGGMVGGLIVAWIWGAWAVGSDGPEVRRIISAIGILVIAVGLVLATGSGKLNAAADCTGLVERVQANSVVLPSTNRAIRADAVDGFLAAAASNRPGDAAICHLLAQINNPEVLEFVMTESVAEIRAFLARN